MDATNPITLALAAGLLATPAIASNDRVPLYTSATVPVETVGHIYYNIATGEKIATALDSNFRPANTTSSNEVWAADNDLPCADYGQTKQICVLVDTPNGEMGQPVREGDLYNDWADIAPDTVVDCLQISYFTGIEDADTNNDGVGDGIEGFAAQWGSREADNGFDDCFCPTGAIYFTLYNLPGQLDGPGAIAGYDLTIDLASDFGSSHTFEFGDSDSDLQGAANHNPGIFDGLPGSCADQDNDGLLDFGYYTTFHQPGTRDTDNADGDNDPFTGIDGDPANKGITALGLSHYRGQTIEIDNGDGTFSYEVIPSIGVNASGSEDGYDIFNSTGVYIGTPWPGGFTCNDPADGTMTAFGQIDLVMYGPNPAPCPADFTDDGVLDIFDVLGFIDAFNNTDPSADFIQDDVYDIFDVLGFINIFNSGCP